MLMLFFLSLPFFNQSCSLSCAVLRPCWLCWQLKTRKFASASQGNDQRIFFANKDRVLYNRTFFAAHTLKIFRTSFWGWYETPPTFAVTFTCHFNQDPPRFRVDTNLYADGMFINTFSTQVLQRMRRGYTSAAFTALVTNFSRGLDWLKFLW